MSDDPTKLLLELAELQSASQGVYMAAEQARLAGDFTAAAAHFESYAEQAERDLALMARFNEVVTEPLMPFDLEPTANTYANARLARADLLQQLGDLDGATTVRNRALEVAGPLLGPFRLTELRRSLATSMASQARFNEALDQLAAVRDDFERLGEPVQVARATIDLVDLLQWVGDHERALHELDRAEALAAPVAPDGTPSTADILGRLGELVTGDFDPGVARGLEQSAELGRQWHELRYYRGLVMKALGRYDEAVELFGEVTPMYESLGVGDAIGYQMAAIDAERGRYREARDAAAELEPTFRNNVAFQAKLPALLRIEAIALMAEGEERAAVARLREGLDVLDAHFDPDLRWRLEQTLADALATAGDRTGALHAYLAAAVTVDGLRKVPLGYRLDSTFFADKVEMFERATVLAADLDDGPAAWRLVEQAKSRLLTTLLGPGRASARSGPTDLTARFEQLSREIDALDYGGYRDGGGSWAQRDELVARRFELLERIRVSDPRWHGITEPPALDLDSLQGSLGTNAALSLFRSGNELVTVLVTRDSVAVERLALDTDTVRALEAHAEDLRSGADPFAVDLSDFHDIEAGDLVPTELLEQALRCEAVVISPHRSLHLVPWAGLVHDGKRLFEYTPITTAPNLSAVVPLAGPWPAEPRPTLIGPPDYSAFVGLQALDGAAEEHRQLLDYYGIRSAPTGSAVTEDVLREALTSEADLIHIACHGVIDDADPAGSALLAQDGKIDAGEIASLRLGADEVILAACSTGWRPTQVERLVLAGDDIVGLPAAFLEAGARSVLVSIPEVHDETAAKFAIRYHINRRRAANPAQALQATQIQMLGDHEPFLWIGWTMYGGL